MANTVNLQVNIEPTLNASEFNRIVNAMKSALGPLGKEIKPIDVAQFESAVKKAATNIPDEFEKAGKKSGEKFSASLGKAFEFNMLIEGVRNVTDVVDKMSDPFVKLDTATARIKTLGGDSKALAGDFRDLSLKMSSDIPIAAGEMQTALYDALSAGIKPTRDGIESFMTSAGKLAIGGGESIGNTVNLLSSITNAYGLAAESAGESSDYLFQTVNLGKTTIPELNQSLSQVIPNAAALGINLKNVGANLALMTANGIPTTQATTKLNQLIIELQKGSKDLTPFLEKAGVTLDSLKKEDLIDNLARLRTEFDKSGKAATQVFGSSEAAAAFNVLTKDIGATKDMLSQMDSAAGSTQAAFEEMENTIENRSERARISFETFVIGAIDKSGALGTALVSGSKILSEMQGPIMALAGLKAVIPTAQIGQLATSLVTRFVPAAVTTSAVTGAATISFKALAAAMLTNPFTIAIAGAIGVVAAYKALVPSQESILAGQRKSLDLQIKHNKEDQDGIKKKIDSRQANIDLAATFLVLAEKTNKSKGEQALFKQKLEDIKKAYPDVVDGTDKLGINMGKLTTAVKASQGEIDGYNRQLAFLEKTYAQLEARSIKVDFKTKLVEFGKALDEARAKAGKWTFWETQTLAIRALSGEITSSSQAVVDGIQKYFDATKSITDVEDASKNAMGWIKLLGLGKDAEELMKDYINNLVTIRSQYWKDSITRTPTGGLDTADICPTCGLVILPGKPHKHKSGGGGRGTKDVIEETNKEINEITLASYRTFEQNQADSLERQKNNIDAWATYTINSIDSTVPSLESAVEEWDKNLTKAQDAVYAMGATWVSLGETVGSALMSGDYKSILKSLLNMMLDAVYAQIMMEEALLMVRNLATPESALTLGVLGLATTGWEIAIVSALYGVAKGLVGSFFRGGWINGPGGPTDDRVPIMASNNEFMVNAAAAATDPKMLEWMNENKRPGYEYYIAEQPDIARKMIEKAMEDDSIRAEVQKKYLRQVIIAEQRDDNELIKVYREENALLRQELKHATSEFRRLRQDGFDKSQKIEYKGKLRADSGEIVGEIESYKYKRQLRAGS